MDLYVLIYLHGFETIKRQRRLQADLSARKSSHSDNSNFKDDFTQKTRLRIMQ